ncbi:MAG: TIGR04283 family arsenosugar biosynthesis glycosyltransferase [Desulfomonilaceae bacterium]
MYSISVIIPTLNEAGYLPFTLERLSQRQCVEIIVADGDSNDETRKIALSLSVKMLDCPRGRARQMNEAARVAMGDILLFLHADTLVPENWDYRIRAALANEYVCGGAFSLRIQGNLLGLRLVEAFANFRSRIFLMPYGDQAIFVRSATFWEVGGFPDVPIMEDFEFMRRLRTRGGLCILPERVIASGRRWKKLGIMRTTAINQAIIAGYYVGISPDKLARFYGNGPRAD